ncbi:MAG: hypothetical protein R6X22_03945 [Gemmatimonadota bacterium]
MTPLLAILAVVAVVGFFWWLQRASAGLDTAVVPVMEEEQQATDINTALLAAEPAAAVGERGWMRFVTVDRRLGRAAFTVRLDSEHSYPVLLAPDLIARGTDVYGNDRVSMFGRVFTLNDSIRKVWVDQAAVETGNANAIPGTPSFFLADSLSTN